MADRDDSAKDAGIGRVARPGSRRSSSRLVQARPAMLQDYEQIHALERRYDLGFRSYDEWSHMWVNNPTRIRVPELPIGWVLQDRDRQIVGSMGSVPFSFEFGGRQLIAAVGTSWVVDERYRAYAPLLLDSLLSQPGIDLALCVSPNAHAAPVVDQQAERVPVGRWDRAAFWITNYRDFTASTLRRRNTPAPWLLRYPVWTAMVIQRLLTRDAVKTALRNAGDHAVTFSTAFDDRFDEFWETVKAANPHRVLFTRSREALAWHFKHPLARHDAWIATVTEGGRLSAYAVLCRKDVAAIGLRRVRLIDYQALDGSTSLLPPILAAAIERCRRERVAVLESIGWQLERGDLLERLAPYSRALHSWQYFYKATNPALASALRERATWNATQYDGDACL